MEITDGVMPEENKVEETTKKTNAEEAKNKKDDLVSFDELLKNPAYKSSYDKKVNELMERKEIEWNKKVQEKTNDEINSKVDEELKKATIDAMNLRIENALLLKGVSATKAERVKRLIDKSSILGDDGKVSQEKLNSEVEKLFEEFPELITSKEEIKTFSVAIGDDGKEEQNSVSNEVMMLRKMAKLKN